jgi:hypothetical protein
MRYEPRIGDEFPLTSDIIVAKTKHLTEVTRSTIALCIIVASLLALAFTAALGALKGDFGYLQTLWAIIAAPLGGIVTFYFRGHILHDQKDNESTA